MIFFQGHTDMIRSNQSPVLVESARTRHERKCAIEKAPFPLCGIAGKRAKETCGAFSVRFVIKVRMLSKGVFVAPRIDGMCAATDFRPLPRRSFF